MIIGPGLGRDDLIAGYIVELISKMKEDQIAVLDADFFWYLIDHPVKDKLKISICNRSRKCILTPNKAEYNRLWKEVLKGNFLLWSICNIPLDKCQVSQEEYSTELKRIEGDDVVLKLEISHPLVKDCVELSKNLNNINILRKVILSNLLSNLVL